jgi:hypothetical protein
MRDFVMAKKPSALPAGGGPAAGFCFKKKRNFDIRQNDKYYSSLGPPDRAK